MIGGVQRWHLCVRPYAVLI